MRRLNEHYTLVRRQIARELFEAPNEPWCLLLDYWWYVRALMKRVELRRVVPRTRSRFWA